MAEGVLVFAETVDGALAAISSTVISSFRKISATFPWPRSRECFVRAAWHTSSKAASGRRP